MTSVEDFMSKLSAQTMPAGKQKEFKEKKRMIEKISLNFEGNFGRYQVLPMDNVVTDYPFVSLRNTREICIPKKMTAQDGTENVFNSWIKIIPAEAYLMKDMTGRVVSSLTAEEEQLLGEANTLFDQLFDECGAKEDMNMQRTLARKRNYTIFHAYCLNKWGFDNNRAPERSNFSGLFVCTASGFTQSVSDNVSERTLMNGGDPSFLKSIYSRQLSGRDGFMMFSISRNKAGGAKGYSISVSHEAGKASMLSNVAIPEDDAKLMIDPLANFLGWQAKKEEDGVPAESRRLFNAPLIKSAINYMTEQLASIRMAKANGTSLEEAIQKTNELTLSTENTEATPKTNDPMLAEMQQTAPSVNAQQVIEQNTNPFATPAAGHFDPITGAPVGAQQTQAAQTTPFTQPSFANFSQTATPDSGSGMPF